MEKLIDVANFVEEGICAAMAAGTFGFFFFLFAYAVKDMAAL